jgi:DNA-binding transcriptional MerR regulator
VLRSAVLHIQAVSRITHVSTDTIRAWEKRYGAVRPTRATGGQRVFTGEDVERLILLREIVSAGEPISHVAGNSTEELRRLVKHSRDAGDTDDAVLVRLLRAVDTRDVSEIASELVVTALARTAVEFGDDVIPPLFSEIAVRAHGAESQTTSAVLVASALVSVSATLFAKYAASNEGPRTLFLTLPGERHALPALLAAFVAAEAGFRSTYAGTEIPPASVEALVRDLDAAGLGIYAGTESPQTLESLRVLSARLPRVTIWAGGPGAQSAPWVTPSQTLREFAEILRACRDPRVVLVSG